MAFAGQVSADTFTGGSYKIDASVIGNSFGGDASGGSYKLTGSGGESIIGQGSGGSYKLDSGYVAQLAGGNGISLVAYPSGIGSWFPFEEQSGTVSDNIAYGTDVANFTGSPTWNASGKIGGAIGGFTSSNYLTASSQSPYDVSRFVACSWVNLSSIGSNQTIMARSDSTVSANGMWSLDINGSGVPVATIRLGDTTYTKSAITGSISTGAWHYVCMGYNESIVKILVDGVFSGSTTVNLPTVLPSADVTIGARTSGSQPLSGKLDETRFITEFYSNQRIAFDYDAMNSGNAAGVVYLSVTPGTPAEDSVILVPLSGSSSYQLAINQDNNLTRVASTETIPSVTNGGTISTPVAWASGTTKGLGFSVGGFYTMTPDSKWGTSPNLNYAALPNSATTFYTRTGAPVGVAERMKLSFSLDTDLTVVADTYKNNITYTATNLP